MGLKPHANPKSNSIFSILFLGTVPVAPALGRSGGEAVGLFVGGGECGGGPVGGLGQGFGGAR